MPQPNAKFEAVFDVERSVFKDVSISKKEFKLFFKHFYTTNTKHIIFQ